MTLALVNNDVDELRKDRDYWLDMWRREKKRNEKKQTDKLITRMRKVKFKAGDTVVIEAPSEITDDTAKRLVDYFKKATGVKAVLLADGLRIGQIIRKKK